MKKGILFSIILAGFTAIVAQIVLVRELLIVFYGNEISLGFIFTGWFIGGAIGSWWLGRIADRLKPKIVIFSLCQFLLSILLSLCIWEVRSIKSFLNLDAGELIAFLPMALSSLIILTPICAVLGFMFSLGSKLYDNASPISATKIGSVYVLETLGSIIGGLLVSFVLVRWLNSLQIMAILSLLNIFGAVLLQLSSKKTETKSIFVAVFTAALIFTIAIWLFGGLNVFNRYLLKKQWKGYELLSSRNSIYGNIVVTKRQTQRSFFYNGLHLYTIPDQLTSEEAVHFALLEHPGPKNVLLIGDGVGGLIKEILKHPIKKVDYVELDPLIIKMAKEYIPDEEYKFLRDQKVSIKNIDGGLFVKGTNDKYDCVIMHLGDPRTAGLNRYYTVEFFKEVKRILEKDGILSFMLSSSESYISRPLKDFLSSVYASLKEAFRDIKVIPGDTAYFLACDKEGILTYDYKILLDRIRARNIDIKYVREYYLFAKLSREKISYTEKSLKENTAIKVNYNFRPTTYYYNLIFLSAHFRGSFFKKILEAANEDRIWQIVFTLCGLILLFGIIRILRHKELHRKASLLAVMTTGFTQMSLQIIILLSFQIIYGYVFYKLGFILSCFMVGLALGGLWIIKIMPRIKRDLTFFIWVQLGIAVYPLLSPMFLHWLSIPKTQTLSWMGANLFFPLMPIVFGFLGGVQFPLANKIYLAERKEVGRAAGLSYGLDLLGSCLGSLLTAIFFIPILGIPKTCSMIAMINLAVLAILIFSSLRKQEIN